MSSKRVFVTGIAGFLGSHVADEFLNLGWEVHGIDNLQGGYLANIPERAVFRKADCNDISAYSDLMKGCHLVYHCAAAAYEGLSVFSPHFVNHHILGATTGVLSAAIQAKVGRFILCSSMARYGTNAVPFREEMVPLPQDPYGVSKYAAELMVRNLAEIHGMEFNIAVPHNIIGPRQKFDDPFRNVASIFINRMLQGKQPIIYGEGNQKRCFSFVQDSLRCLMKMGLDAEIRGETINIGPDEEFVTIMELAKEVAGQLDFALDPIFIPSGRPQEVKYANCSADKARRLLGYRTEYTLSRGIAEMIEYIRKCGPRPFQYHIDLEIINERTPKTWTERLI